MAGFGRRPRLSSGNASAASAISAMIRQMDAQEWQNVQDAWKNGGTVKDEDGNEVPVTDQYLLDYMAKRRDEFDPADPDWAEWNNGLNQVRFSVEESKIGLRFKQGKVSASTVSNFYKNSLAQFPTDSEIYRDISGKAADWAKSARASAAGAARSKLESILSKRITAAETTKAQFTALEQDLTETARQMGFIGDGQKLGDMLEPQKFWDRLNQPFLPVVGALSGKVLTKGDWDKAVTDTTQAYDTNIAALTQLGAGKDAAQETAEKGTWVTNKILPTKSLDAKTEYDMASDTYKAAIKAANNYPAAIKAARAQFAASLSHVISTANEDPQKDTGFVSGVLATIDALNGVNNGGKTWEQISGNVKPGESPDTVEELLLDGQQALDWEQGLANKSLIYAQVDDSGQPSPGGVFRPTPPPVGGGGTFVANDHSGALKLTTITVNGQQVEAWAAGKEIRNSTILDSSGKAVEGKSDAEIEAGVQQGIYSVKPGALLGYLYVNPDGAKRWGVFNGTAPMTFSDTDPFTGSDLVDSKGSVYRYIPTLPYFGSTGTLKPTTTDPTKASATTPFLSNSLSFDTPVSAPPEVTKAVGAITGAASAVQSAWQATQPKPIPSTTMRGPVPTPTATMNGPIPMPNIQFPTLPGAEPPTTTEGPASVIGGFMADWLKDKFAPPVAPTNEPYARPTVTLPNLPNGLPGSKMKGLLG